MPPWPSCCERGGNFPLLPRASGVLQQGRVGGSVLQPQGGGCGGFSSLGVRSAGLQGRSICGASGAAECCPGSGDPAASGSCAQTQLLPSTTPSHPKPQRASQTRRGMNQQKRHVSTDSYIKWVCGFTLCPARPPWEGSASPSCSLNRKKITKPLNSIVQTGAEVVCIPDAWAGAGVGEGPSKLIPPRQCH